MASRPDFTATGGLYRIAWGEPEFVTIEFELLRSERSGELTGEVSVWATPDGLVNHLHTARMNLTSTRSRSEVARYCRERSDGHQPDWAGAIDLACLRTIAAYRAGEPAILLRDAEQPAEVGDILPPILLSRLPTIIFGDGGSAKSLLALAFGLSIDTGEAITGLAPANRCRVGLLDWEMDAWEHRARMEALGASTSGLVYIPCRRPLVDEVDRLRRIIRRRDLGYLIVDSVGLACDGPPEAAEVANRFFGALRQLERGSLCIAHTTKADESERPFGSTFWHNGARRTWYVKNQQDIGGDTITVGLYNRKANTGPKSAPLAFQVTFGDRTTVLRTDIRDVAELAAKLPLSYRITGALRSGSMTVAQLADALESDTDTVRKTLNRKRDRFVCLPGPDGVSRWGLVA